MKPVLEYRELRKDYGVDFEVRVHDDGKRLGGLGIPFGQWSDDLGGFKERMSPGAFTTSIENDDIRAIFNHNSDFVLGRQSAGTLRLNEDERGVHFEVDVPNTTWAHDLVESISRGDIRENSFGFMTLSDHWEERDGMLWRTVKEATLRELGPQVFPAYPQSDVQVRSMEDVLCVGRSCVRVGADPDVLAREMELDRRLRAG